MEELRFALVALFAIAILYLSFKAKKKNKNTFITELLNNLDGLEDNLLYDDISNTKNGIVDEIFEVLIDKQEMTAKDLINVFAKFDNYIVTLDNKKIKKEIEQIVKAINFAYKTSKKDFIWEEKVKSNKKNVQAQLDGVSKAHVHCKILSMVHKWFQSIEQNDSKVVLHNQ